MENSFNETVRTLSVNPNFNVSASFTKELQDPQTLNSPSPYETQNQRQFKAAATPTKEIV